MSTIAGRGRIWWNADWSTLYHHGEHYTCARWYGTDRVARCGRHPLFVFRTISDVYMYACLDCPDAWLAGPEVLNAIVVEYDEGPPPLDLSVPIGTGPTRKVLPP